MYRCMPAGNFFKISKELNEIQYRIDDWLFVMAQYFYCQFPTASAALAAPGDTNRKRPWRRGHGFYPPSRAAAALSGSPSPFLLSLDGTWKFRLDASPAARPDSFYADHYDVSNWKDIKVPAHWQTEGFDKFIFHGCGISYSRKSAVSAGERQSHRLLPQELYHSRGMGRQECNPPLRRRKFLFCCWINGRYIGFSKDSKTAAEFDITHYLRKGENTVSLQVLRSATLPTWKGRTCGS